MKGLFIIANWKSNKTVAEASNWLQQISNLKSQISNNTNKQIIICPPFTALSEVKSLITNYQLPISLGAQDISPHDEGVYTGEINARQIKEFADYVIIGHSERRKNFGENEETINKKLEMAGKHGLIPILCISDTKQISNYQLPITNFKLLIVYEPVFTIGTGNPDRPENADKATQEIKEKGNMSALYGGSVTADNVKTFTQMPNIDGVLVGGASLDAQHFAKIIINA